MKIIMRLEGHCVKRLIMVSEWEGNTNLYVQTNDESFKAVQYLY